MALRSENISQKIVKIDLAVIVGKEELFPLSMREVKLDSEDVCKDDGWGRIIRTRLGIIGLEAGRYL